MIVLQTNTPVFPFPSNCTHQAAGNPLGPELSLMRHSPPCQLVELIYLEKGLCVFLGVEPTF